MLVALVFCSTFGIDPFPTFEALRSMSAGIRLAAIQRKVEGRRAFAAFLSNAMLGL
jgi:hypothetical protein